jgi:hypothetical protein
MIRLVTLIEQSTTTHKLSRSITTTLSLTITKESVSTEKATSMRLLRISAKLLNLNPVKLTSTIIEALHSERRETSTMPSRITPPQFKLMTDILRLFIIEPSVGIKLVS